MAADDRCASASASASRRTPDSAVLRLLHHATPLASPLHWHPLGGHVVFLETAAQIRRRPATRFGGRVERARRRLDEPPQFAAAEAAFGEARHANPQEPSAHLNLAYPDDRRGDAESAAAILLAGSHHLGGQALDDARRNLSAAAVSPVHP